MYTNADIKNADGPFNGLSQENSLPKTTKVEFIFMALIQDKLKIIRFNKENKK